MWFGLEKTAKTYDLKLSGEFKTCEECVIAEARQKNLTEMEERKSSLW